MITRKGARLTRRFVLAVCLVSLIAGQSAMGQDITLGGFVKAESIYDTRQVAQVREGQFHLYPLAKVDLNGDGIDDNETNNLLFAAFQSRLKVAGVDTTRLGAKLSGVIEVDFFGSANDNVSQLRLRHAFVKIAWPRHELLFGQYWSPMFMASVYPLVVNFSTGAPFQPFARYPQVRYTYKPGPVQVIAALSQQRDAFQEIGGRKLQQQSGLPAGHLHFQYVRGDFLAGVGGTMKAVRPDISGDRFHAKAVQVYAKLTVPDFAIRSKVTYGHDLADHLMTGGFLTLDNNEYSCLSVLATWLDITTTSKPWTYGLFAGYLTNLGAEMEMNPDMVLGVNARVPNMKSMWRLSPRVSYSINRLRVALEIETTSANYVSGYSDKYKPISLDGDEPVLNVRTLFAVYYFF